MGKLGSKMRRIAADWLELPRDVAGNLPRVIMIGPYRVHVENHQGVEHFNMEEIRMRTEKGQLAIRGKSLIIHAIYSDEVWVEGEISEVKYLG
ncbi:hypothetical protein GCM10007416_06600 [Kroppenstedtia guangzhouensis]|jgi:sporulation protein YqfC|uniref:Sporulation protein YqfC n=1 Tax=Kroppenstedtia guangzhouensis TaxID=1274356 RepID=A0ABQ1G4F3_9BACL|nr:sporulation protein YqfC [Kroppenstedtia guangzhouensis]GGA36384.1 hypothetical protein GCM10007416_06600 [Kroppenstedtia guangzhouensis]